MALESELRSERYLTSLRQAARQVQGSLRLPQSLEVLWPALSNTDVINAEAELEPVSFFPQPAPGGGTLLHVESRDLGMKLAFAEFPYEWEKPHWLKVERVYSQGPIRYLCFEVRLSSLGPDETDVHVSIQLTPRLPWLFLKPRIQHILNKQLQVYRNLNQRGQTTSTCPLAGELFLADPARHQAAIEALLVRWQALSPNPHLLRAVAEYVYTAPGAYVLKLRPFELARLYGLERMETLRFFLQATAEGFFNLSWDLLCPSCQGAKQTSSSLSQVNAEVHCDSCDIDYSVALDENFELTFYPVPSVRNVNEQIFCAGSPANTQHIFVQKNLWPGQTQTVQVQLKPGQYCFRALTMAGRQLFEVRPGGLERFELNMTETLSPQEDLCLAPSCELTLHNPRAIFQHLKLECLDWRRERVTAALVSTLQDFRDMFGGEVLRPGVKLEVANLSFMFTDLKDSTRMYDLQGDASAFNLVQEHFDMMHKLIAEYDGAVVKTIGDAVMAVFESASQALACGLQIQQTFAVWNQTHQDQPQRQIILKMGLHKGPCIALNLNQRLDYFGATINKAARIQSESVGQDLVLSEELLAEPGVREQLPPERYVLEAFSKNLKGISQAACLYRVGLNA